MEDEGEIDRARNELRALHTGTLVADGAAYPARFVVNPADGSIVVAVEPEALDATEFLLCAPDESEDSFQLLCGIEPCDESADGAMLDRWMAHHSERRGDVWARARVESIKRGREVWDGADLLEPNALGADEPALLRELNRDRSRLIALLAHHLGVQTTAPVAVAIDHLGVDVRTRFDIARLQFESRVADAEAARAALAAMLEEASA